MMTLKFTTLPCWVFIIMFTWNNSELTIWCYPHKGRDDTDYFLSVGSSVRFFQSNKLNLFTKTGLLAMSSHRLFVLILPRSFKHLFDRNCSLAFHLAEVHLGIAPLLDVEDVVGSKHPDTLSIMTYVAQFYHKFEQRCLPSASGWYEIF